MLFLIALNLLVLIFLLDVICYCIFNCGKLYFYFTSIYYVMVLPRVSILQCLSLYLLTVFDYAEICNDLCIATHKISSFVLFLIALNLLVLIFLLAVIHYCIFNCGKLYFYFTSIYYVMVLPSVSILQYKSIFVLVLPDQILTICSGVRSSSFLSVWMHFVVILLLPCMYLTF